MSTNSDECSARFELAEAARKEGDWRRAASRYADAIRCVEKNGEGNSGTVPPDPYRECAKMLYHVGEIEVALEVIERYLAVEEQSDESSVDDLEVLRERLASRDMQQQPWRYGED